MQVVTASIDQRSRLDAKLRRELGDTVLHFLQDDRTEDICLNPDGKLWVKRLGGPFEAVGEMSSAQAQSALGTIAAQRGTVVNYDRPILEAELPLDGSRFEGIISPVVRHPVFAIRLRPRRVSTLEEYQRNGILTDRADPLNRLKSRRTFLEEIRGLALTHSEIIRRAIAGEKNILVVGSTGSGKTTLVNAMWSARCGAGKRTPC